MPTFKAGMWPDASRGLPEPGMSYAQALTPVNWEDPAEVARYQMKFGGADGFPGGGGGREIRAMPTLQELLSQVYGQTEPLRTGAIKTLSDVLGGAPASSLPAYAPNRAAIEGQYNVAAEQARSMLPRGGQLNRALIDLSRSRAGAVGGLESSVRGEALNKAMSLGFGMVPGLISGTGGVETAALSERRLGLENEIAQQTARNQMIGNIGMGMGLLGTILGQFWN